ncbi:Scr1 family TA system antitoxin-like transcriptional regulator [Streptomyces sp. NPDC047079]|uniref:Scr1 family TA system antitoxin-like transcriptional regulator n=1 Tax=Streptomyces sp. NPDC047079 TaxID=3154607 RepID=UPI0033FB0FB0
MTRWPAGRPCLRESSRRSRTAGPCQPPALPEETRARTVAARLERQATLYEDGRSFHFVICEHVLRGRHGYPRQP